ncbi:shikimate dehydrogenase [Longimonas halophila]|uniref:Shikimate dehydrogenase (NADP(+)) n=1 Tax=Longimonas halophila TaxID=1469170 RepID=A0A2H3NJD2_9BACT|nr:shikimate dehydrogenase [Longimonas halophila]PEN05773.1 shikimate dehydrogenase [Longimonas halophila]
MSTRSTSLDASTRIVLLLGDPVEHSLSPCIHNTAFATHNINAVYAATQVKRDDLADAVRGMRALRLLGANVTIPHKERIVPLLDSVSSQAEALGAVNTVVARSNNGTRTLHGDNTDVEGFLAPLRSRSDLHGQPMTILGAGGAARAAAYALGTSYAPAPLTVAARRPKQAQALVDALTPHVDPEATLTACVLDDATAAVRSSRLVVNATPVGMAPNTDATPWPNTECFAPGQLIYDLVYTPRPTRLLREAASRGADTQDGLAMLIGQAASSYEMWTDRPMPTSVVREEVASRLAIAS